MLLFVLEDFIPILVYTIEEWIGLCLKVFLIECFFR